MDDEDEEILYGTPLPPLEDNENANKKPEIDLTVRDWKGRRRFHGAFTGGFSAGYFNTVGTEKGWIPSQYVSKKEERWNKNLCKSRPEDFMDEEDFSLFGIAPKKVHTKDDFKGPETAAFAGLRDTNASFTDVLKDIIKPTTQSIGVKLFTAMKKGRRYKDAFVKPKSSAKVYGCSMPPEFDKATDENDLCDEPFVQPEIFSLPYTPKNDFHGIGYKPLKSDLTNDPEKTAPLTAILSGNKRLKITGEAFGYGALEEDDDYAADLLIYSKEDLSNYDFEIGPVKNKDPKPSTSAALPSTSKSTLLGFVKAKRIDPFKSSRNRLPEIPKNWKPHPPFLKSKRPSRWNQPPSAENDGKKSTSLKTSDSIESSTISAKPESKYSQLNANARAVLLGEEVEIVVGLKKKLQEKKNTSTSEQDMKLGHEPNASSPMSSFFSSKFVRSSELAEDKLEPGLTESRKIASDKQETLLDNHEEVKSSIGLIKRETYQWHPHTLLSKRFNVPHPYPQFPDVVGVLNINQNTVVPENKKSKTKPQLFSSLFTSPNEFSSSCSKTTGENNSLDISPTQQATETVHTEVSEMIERPPLDLFKAIFASDESESESECEKEKDDITKIEKETELVDKNFPKNDMPKFQNQMKTGGDNPENIIQRNQVIQLKPGSSKAGIFSGINLDLLSKSISYKIDNWETELPENDPKETEIEDSYGPALPPTNVDSSYSVRTSNRKKKDKKRKKSKSKSRHKSKKSKKRHRRRSSSDSESSQTDSSDSDH